MLNLQHVLLFLCLSIGAYVLIICFQKGHPGTSQPCSTCKKGPVTLFIHGTFIPIISYIKGYTTNRRGLYARSIDSSSDKPTFATMLHNASPKEFPAQSFYTYYWSGSLSITKRKQEAQNLFCALRYHKGPLTIITHSHGANIALHLAEYAHQNQNEFYIERLILLAPPVQQVTAHYIQSPLFKRVYSFYSQSDFLQIADPQGLYQEPQKNSSDLPFFSERTFASASHLTQAQILIDGESPGHFEFIKPYFLKKLPELLEHLDKAHEHGNNHIRINVSQTCSNAYVLHKTHQK